MDSSITRHFHYYIMIEHPHYSASIVSWSDNISPRLKLEW